VNPVKTGIYTLAQMSDITSTITYHFLNLCVHIGKSLYFLLLQSYSFDNCVCKQRQ